MHIFVIVIICNIVWYNIYVCLVITFGYSGLYGLFAYAFWFGFCGFCIWMMFYGYLILCCLLEDVDL